MKQQNFNHIIQGLKNILEYQDLRKAQIDIFKEFLENPELQTTGIFDLATGFGKTRMMNVLASAFLHSNPQGKIIVVVPTVDLIKDSNGNGMMKRFIDYHQMYSHEPLDIGAFYTHSKQTKNQVIVTTYSSLKNLATKINPEDIGLLLLDEAHHAVSKNRSDTIRLFKNACWYGLTATPAYSPDKDLSALLGSVIAEMNTPQAIKDGLLTSCKNVLLSSKIKVDLSKIKKDTQGNYEEKEFESVLQKALKAYQDEGNATNWKNVHNLIAHEIALFYQNYIDETIGAVQNKKCMINCRSQAEARLQAHTLNKVFGKMVAGTWTSDSKDKSVLNKFVNGNLPILCQVGKLSEGFDMPELDMCINYPTCSRVVEAQRGGRVLRLNPQNQSKFSLIVDIVFSHPEYDNPILSSHANGQVLYRDIIGKSVILNEKKDTTKALSSSTHVKKSSSQLKLSSFEIISSIEDLITLENSFLEQNNAYFIRENWLSAQELYHQFFANLNEIRPLLKKAFEEKITFSQEDKSIPLVQKNGQTYFLANTPNSLQQFEIYAKNNHIDLKKRHHNNKREGMLTSRDLYKLFLTNPNDLRKLLKIGLEESITFHVEKKSFPLIEVIVTGGRSTPALNEHPVALQKFEELANAHNIQLKLRDSNPVQPFISLSDLRERFIFAQAEVSALLKDIFLEKASFKLGNKIIPLIILNQAKHQLGIYNHPKALHHILKLANERNVRIVNRNIIKNKHSTILTLNELKKQFSISIHNLRMLLKKCIEEKIAFSDGELSRPLAEYVTLSGHPFLALNAHPNAVKKFETICKNNGFLIKNKKEGMLTVYDLAKILHTTFSKLNPYLDKYFNQNKTFEVNGVTYPLIEQVKSSSSTILALHEHPEALEQFKNLLREENCPFGYSHKRLGMLSVHDLYRTINKSMEVTLPLFKKLFDKKATFFVDGKPYPLIEMVCSRRYSLILAIHEHPKALEAFLQEAKKMGITLEPRTQKITTQKISTKQDNQRQNNG